MDSSNKHRQESVHLLQRFAHWLYCKIRLLKFILHIAARILCFCTCSCSRRNVFHLFPEALLSNIKALTISVVFTTAEPLQFHSVLQPLRLRRGFRCSSTVLGSFR